MSIMLGPWEDIKSEITDAVVAGTEQYLPVISDSYGIPRKHYCMVLGPGTTGCHIICSHVWPKRTNGKGLDVFGLNPTDLNRPRNFLRLHRTIGRAFDRKRLYFELSDTAHADDQIILKVVILDPTLMNEEFEYVDKTVRIKMNTIHNKDFRHVFVGEVKPYIKLLAVHANQAINKAKLLGWIPDEDDYAARRERALTLARLSLNEAAASVIV